MPPKRFQKKTAVKLGSVSTVADETNDSDDYMGSDFVQVQTDKKRELESEKEIPPVKKLVVLMTESRERGLERELGSDNIGFKLLSKMGFQPGTGLGLKESGRTQPVDVKVPEGRGGLGRAEEERRREDAALAASKAVEISRSSQWQEHQQERFRHRRLTVVASRAALAVRDLDERAGLPRSELWPVEDNEPSDALEIEGDTEEERVPPQEIQLVAARDGSEYARKTDSISIDATARGSNSVLTAAELELQLLQCVDYLQTKHEWSLLHGCSQTDLKSRCVDGSQIPATAEDEVLKLLEEQ